MAESCCEGNGSIMILACSGASNVGQLSNQAAIELTREGWGKMFCLAGVGAHLSGFVQSAKDVPHLVVVDGCEVGCARLLLEHAEVPLRNYLIITELGIAKNHDFDLQRRDIEQVKDALRNLAGQAGKESLSQTGQSTGSCCS